MELKLKAGLEESEIYIPFERRNIVGKFIDKGLYPFLYEKYPDLFDIIEDKKTKTTNDKFIGDTITGSDNNIEGKVI
jgi:hypothetical protein